MHSFFNFRTWSKQKNSLIYFITLPVTKLEFFISTIDKIYFESFSEKVDFWVFPYFLCLAFLIVCQRNRFYFVFKSPILIQPLWYMIHNFNLKLSRHFHSRRIMFQLPIMAWCKSYPGELFLEKERQFNFKFIWQPPLVLLFKMNNWPFLKHLHNSIAPTRIWVFPWGELEVHFLHSPLIESNVTLQLGHACMQHHIVQILNM